MFETRDIEVDGDLYLRRTYICGLKPSWAKKARLGRLPCTVYLHEFFRPDQARHLHNHPWSAFSIILSGGYLEKRLRSERWLRRGDFNLILDDTFHTISEILPGTKTLFIVGPRNKLPERESWGFLTKFGYMTLNAYEEVVEKYGQNFDDLQINRVYDE